MWGWIFYIIGCVIALILNILASRAYWGKSTKDEKLFTVLLWFPFMAAVSWLGIVAFIGLALVSGNGKDSDN